MRSPLLPTSNGSSPVDVITAFGPRAQEYAAGIGDLDAVVTDVESLGHAYVEAVRRRELGHAFYGLVLYQEPRARAILAVAAKILEQVTGFDERRLALDRLGAGVLTVDGKPASALWTGVPAAASTMREFLSLCNCTLVRSFAEGARFAEMIPRLRSIEPVLVEPAVPPVGPRLGSAPGVVVWAPNYAAGYVAWYASALAEFFGNVACVTGGGTLPANVPAQFVAPADPALDELLAEAQCVLCPDPDDPGAAVAFARRGFGVAAPRTSGAHEFVRDIVTFELATQKDVEVAVKTAITRPAGVRWVPAPPQQPAIPPLPAPADELPLVSVIVATYNRPDDLERCLGALARQTYPRMEVVVLNDAGQDVGHIVERFDFARYVDLPANIGVLKLMNEGLNQVRGAYVQILADDDTLYPDHIERLIGAMLRTGAAVAHGNALIRYQERLADGTLRVSGFNAQIFDDSTTATEALTATPIAGQSLIYRRDVFDEIGTFSEETRLADQEFQMRAAGRYVFAYINQMTAEWRVRGAENASASGDGGADLRQVFEGIHPVPGRPIVEESRRRALEGFTKRPKGYIFPPTVLVQRS